MATPVWKDVLWAGTFRVKAPGGKVIAHTITPRDVRNAYEQGRAMLAAGRDVPCCWAHQDVLSLSRQERAAHEARNVYGWVGDYRLAPDGTLQARLDVEDPEDVRRLRRVRYCSPRVLWDWMDETGRVWHGATVQHIAATPVPVQMRQNRFLQMSRGGAGAALVGVDLSRDDYTELLMPATQTPKTLLDLADDEKADDTGAAAGDAGAGDAEMPPVPEGGDGGGNELVRKAVECLARAGLSLGDGAESLDVDDFLHRLIAAAETKAAADGGPGNGNGQAAPVGEDTVPGAMGGAGGIVMSREAEIYKRAADDANRDRRAARVKALAEAGRITPAQRDRLLGKLRQVDFSYGPDGRVSSPIDETLELLELGPAGKASKQADMDRGLIGEAQVPGASDPIQAGDPKRKEQELREEGRARGRAVSRA